MQNIKIVYDPKAEKQLQKLEVDRRRKIEQAITGNSIVVDETGKLKSVYSGYTGNFMWIYAEKHKVLIRTELSKNRILVMDICLQRGQKA